MVSRLSIFVVLFGLIAAPAFAQEVDARAALLASLKAMGGENLKTIEISAAGSSSLIGQQVLGRGQLAAVRGGQLHAGHRLRRQVVARGLHASSGQLPDVWPRADGRAAHHRDRERLLRLGHARRDAGAGHPSVPRWRGRERPAAARARDHAAWVSQSGPRQPRTRKRSRFSTSGHRTSVCRSSAGR